MWLRRCPHLLLEPVEIHELDVASLLRGQPTFVWRQYWQALSSHRDSPLTVNAAQMAMLGRAPVRRALPRDEIQGEAWDADVDVLLENGFLIICEADPEARFDPAQPVAWHPLAAIAHRQLRWRDVDSRDTEAALERVGGVSGLEELFGPVPDTHVSLAETAQPVPLPTPPHTALDELLQGRSTCRNFDAARAVPLPDVAAVLAKVFGANARTEVSGLTALKKRVPSAGGLHPTEAYLLVQNVEGLAPGLYHYDSVAHRLETLRTLATDEARDLAGRCVAHQTWFEDAPVIVFMICRFQRTFWKYRTHPKAYRAVIVDAGHLSMMQYLAATELGLGSFFTAAINEIEIEQALGLDPMQMGVMAMTGLGYRGPTMQHLEFDPLRQVWPAWTGDNATTSA